MVVLGDRYRAIQHERYRSREPTPVSSPGRSLLSRALPWKRGSSRLRSFELRCALLVVVLVSLIAYRPQSFLDFLPSAVDSHRYLATSSQRPPSSPLLDSIHAQCFLPSLLPNVTTPWRLQRAVAPQYDGDETLLVYPKVHVGEACRQVGDGDVVIATHLTVNRLSNLAILVRRWATPTGGGCVSAGVLLCDRFEHQALLSAIEANAWIRRHVMFHIVMGRFKNYPYNVMRNVALEPWNSAFSWELKDVREPEYMARSYQAHGKAAYFLDKRRACNETAPPLKVAVSPGHVRPLQPGYNGSLVDVPGTVYRNCSSSRRTAAPAVRGLPSEPQLHLEDSSGAGVDPGAVVLVAAGEGAPAAAPRRTSADGGGFAPRRSLLGVGEEGAPQLRALSEGPDSLSGPAAPYALSAVAGGPDPSGGEGATDDERGDAAALGASGVGGARPFSALLRSLWASFCARVAITASQATALMHHYGVNWAPGLASTPDLSGRLAHGAAGEGSGVVGPGSALGDPWEGEEEGAGAPLGTDDDGGWVDDAEEEGHDRTSGSAAAAPHSRPRRLQQSPAPRPRRCPGSFHCDPPHLRLRKARPWLLTLDVDGVPSCHAGMMRVVIAEAEAEAFPGQPWNETDWARLRRTVTWEEARLLGDGSSADSPEGGAPLLNCAPSLPDAAASEGSGALQLPHNGTDSATNCTFASPAPTPSPHPPAPMNRISTAARLRRLYALMPFQFTNSSVADDSFPRTSASSKLEAHTWLRERYERHRMIVFSSDFVLSAYRGMVDVPSWLRIEGSSLLNRYGGRAAVDIPYIPRFEPYFLARPPLPPFPETYRGRGFSKSGWFFEMAGTGEYSIHLLPKVFTLMDTLADDYRRSENGTVKIRRARSPNQEYFEDVLRSYGMREVCNYTYACVFLENPQPGWTFAAQPMLLRAAPMWLHKESSEA